MHQSYLTLGQADTPHPSASHRHRIHRSLRGWGLSLSRARSWSGSVLQNSLQLSSKKSGPPFFKAPGLGPKEVIKHREDTYGHSSAITSANCSESFYNLTRDGPQENLASMCWCSLLWLEPFLLPIDPFWGEGWGQVKPWGFQSRLTGPDICACWAQLCFRTHKCSQSIIKFYWHTHTQVYK